MLLKRKGHQRIKSIHFQVPWDLSTTNNEREREITKTVKRFQAR